MMPARRQRGSRWKPERPCRSADCGVMLGGGRSDMERMGSLDAVFIAVEDAVNHMHIGSVGIFEGPVPSYEAVRALLAAKLQLVPRYRQRVREAPASVGRPLWIDDVD